MRTTLRMQSLATRAHAYPPRNRYRLILISHHSAGLFAMEFGAIWEAGAAARGNLEVIALAGFAFSLCGGGGRDGHYRDGCKW